MLDNSTPAREISFVSPCLQFYGTTKHDKEGVAMSKMAAIDVAVRLQLISENKIIDYQQTLNTAAPGYNYDESGIQTFLLSVANRLKLDNPSLSFAWRSLDPAKCTTATLPLLEAMIEDATTTPKI
jgi:hypothetical protein